MSETTVQAANRCCIRVYGSSRSYSMRGHMCQKSAIIQHEGAWYCGIHNPVAKAVRDAERKAKFDAEQEGRNKIYALNRAAAEMLELLKESQTSIGGDWRERRDAIVLKAQGTK